MGLKFRVPLVGIILSILISFYSLTSSEIGVNFNVPENSPDRFLGREYFLEHMDEAMRKKGTVAIIGSPQYGKTETALQFIHKSQAQGIYDNYIWIDATNLDSLQTLFVQLAEHDQIKINIDVKTNAESLDLNEMKELIRNIYLKLNELQSRTLIIFDGASTMMTGVKHDIVDFLEFLPSSLIMSTTEVKGQPHILITSQDGHRDWTYLNLDLEILPLAAFSQQEILDIIGKELDLNLKDEEKLQILLKNQDLMDHLNLLDLRLPGSLRNFIDYLNSEVSHHLGSDKYKDAIVNAVESKVAFVLVTRSKFPEASQLFEKIERKQTEIYGPNHRDTLKTRSSKAAVILYQGDVDSASASLQPIYEKQVKLLGEDHSNSMETLHQIATVWGKQQEKADLERLVEIIGPIQGTGFFGSTLGKLTIGAATVGLATVGLPVALAGLGFTSTGIAAGSLAAWIQGTVYGGNVLAGSAFATLQSLGVTGVTLSTFSSFTGLATSSIGLGLPFLLSRNGNGDEGEKEKKEELQKLIRLSLKHLEEQLEDAPHDKQRFDLQREIAFLLFAKDESSRAVRVYEELEEGQRRLFGSKHQDTLKTRYHKASVLIHQGKLDEALKLLEQVYGHMKIALGPTHSDTVNTLRLLGVVREKQGKIPDALKIYRQVYKSWNKKKKTN